MKSLWESFIGAINDHEKYLNPRLKKFIELIYDEVKDRTEEMSTMGNLLQLNVEDLLVYVQIKSARFIKEV